MSKMDNWFRKHDPRRKAEDQRRRHDLATMQSIIDRQNSGEITGEQGAIEADEMFMRASGDGRLIYYSDSTGLTAEWDENVMLFPAPGSTRELLIPSNTGIFARGPQRGYLITMPSGEVPNAMPDIVQHFMKGSKGWINGPVERSAPESTEPPPEAKP